MTALRDDTRGTVSVEQGPLSGDALLVLFHDRLLGTRLYIHSLSRFSIAAAIVAGTYFARDVVGIEGLRVPAFLALAGLLALYNVPVFLVARRYAGAGGDAPPHRLLTGLMHATIFLDFVCLTLLLCLVGGAKSPFKAFYLIHVILAALLLSPRAAYAHGALGYAMFTALLAGQWFGWIPFIAPVGAVNSAQPLDGRYIVTVLVVQGILMTFAAFLMSGLARMLREGEKRLGDANAELTRLSKMRRAFLHITLHDLKAPADAMTMMLTNLLSGLGGPLSEQQSHWVQRCQARLREMSAFLHDFQTLAMLDSGSLGEQEKPVDIANLLRSIVEENRDLADARMHTMSLSMNGSPMTVGGVERLLKEAIANLVTNAIKYTPLGGQIEVRAKAANGRVCVEVEDNGIGISEEDRQKLFQEFVRLRPRQDRTGDVPGSGLGLSIVHRIVEMHQGQVRVVSAPDKGSTFSLDLPARP
ncbi:MAG: HAMP domain-containing histidine kinase [Candidatus Hydrogenedentes bacterium]|nr:HAMP domain-containing histidine kinase [Candidatus Hydrogenedentota bacterium]